MRLKPSDIGPCWDLPLSRMRSLRARNFVPHRILDIGAYRGAWSEVMWHVWPEAKFHLIEANEECEPYLQTTGFTYDIALLSDKVESVVYHKCQTGSGEGNGLFKENSVYPFIATVKETTRLDDLFGATAPGHQPTRGSFSFIKLDCQGAELKVIAGGVNLIREAHVVQLETQIQDYNEGAPRMAEVIARMAELGFRIYDIVDFHLNSKNMLIQADLIFVQADSLLFRERPLT